MRLVLRGRDCSDTLMFGAGCANMGFGLYDLRHSLTAMVCIVERYILIIEVRIQNPAAMKKFEIVIAYGAVSGELDVKSDWAIKVSCKHVIILNAIFYLHV